jgi:hypothetical protein
MYFDLQKFCKVDENVHVFMYYLHEVGRSIRPSETIEKILIKSIIGGIHRKLDEFHFRLNQSTVTLLQLNFNWNFRLQT